MSTAPLPQPPKRSPSLSEVRRLLARYGRVTNSTPPARTPPGEAAKSSTRKRRPGRPAS